MVRFERRDPFPFKDEGTYSKSEAKAHAREADRYLGLRIDEIEARLNSGGSKRPAPACSGDHQQLWFGLDPQDLLTPYLEIRSSLEVLSRLKPSAHVVDLGAAYARMGFVIEREYPRMTFTGFEYVGERVAEGLDALKRFGAKRARLEHADLTSKTFQLPQADIFFIYDYGTPVAIEKTLFDLKRRAAKQEILLVARGRNCRYAIEAKHKWLEKLHPRSAEAAITIYRSNLDFVGRIETPMEYGI